MTRKHAEFPYSKPSDSSVAADILLLQEPEEEEDEEGEKGDGTTDENDDEGDNGFSE
jgi:hypothetical protein